MAKNGFYNVKYIASEDLAVIVGTRPITRAQVIKKLWAYIKDEELQTGRIIHPDEVLRPVLGSRDIDMLKMQKKLSEHLTRVS